MDLIEVMGDGHYATTPLTDEEQAKDDLGFTHPHLHRRIDNSTDYQTSGELLPREYKLNIMGTDSYRNVSEFVHDEEGINDEIP